MLGVYARVPLGVYAHGARERGTRDGGTGTVTVMQRAGSGLNADLHFHTLALDGVFSEDDASQLGVYHPGNLEPEWELRFTT